LSCFRACLAISAVAILLGMSAVAGAQEATSPSATGPRPATAPARADLYYLPDTLGNLVPVPGFTWEEFEQLLAIQRRELGAEQPPRVVLDHVRIDGQVEGDRATLAVDIDVNINTLDWVAVPLRFDRCILREHSATGCELRLEPAVEGRGFTAWLKSEHAGPAGVRLKLLKALDRSGAAGAITLHMPRAARAELGLRVPYKDVLAELPEDEGLVQTTAAEQGGTLISVQAVADVLHLAWSSNDLFEPNPPTLEATGQLAVQVAPDGISTEARLTLRSTNRPIENVQVRLPFGARLLPERQASYSTSLLSQETDDEPAVAEIRLHEPNTVAEVRIQTRQDWPPTERALDLAGFAVVDATRQHGFVALRVSEDLRAQWEERALVRQVDELPAMLRDPQPTAGFEYTGQPFALMAKVSERVTRVLVEPQYLVTVAADTLLLKARLRCRVRDGSLHRLSIQMQDWMLDDEGWGPAGLIAEEDLSPLAGGESLIVPFQRPVTGEFELRFEARRPIVAGAANIAFTLPRPEATAVGPAQLVVQAADNVRLAPRPESQLRLDVQRPDAGMNLPSMRQPPQFYRGDVAQARYEAGFEVRLREVRSAVAVQAKWNTSHIEVRQRIKYRVENDALDRLSLLLPTRGVAGSNLRLTLAEAEPVPLTWSAAERSSATATTVFLPRPLIGDFEIDVRFDLPLPSGPLLDLPIVQPGNSQDAGCALELQPSSGHSAKPASGLWQPDADPATVKTPNWSARQTPTAVAIEIGRDDRGALDQDLVERAWLQTQLFGEQRQDRVVWRVIAPDGSLTIRLPDTVRVRDVLATLDGAAVAIDQDARGNAVLNWPAAAERQAAHVIELDYRSEHIADDSARQLLAPQLVSAGRMKQTMWEIMLPTDEHLLAASNGYQLECHWSWQRGLWVRRPHWTSEELRRWSGGASRGELPSGSNRYLLSATGRPGSLALRKGTRSSLVLATSTLLLIAGLLIMFAPARLRSAVTLFLALSAVVGLTYSGDLAILLAQAAAPGLLAMLVAVGLHAWQQRRRGPVMLLQGSTHTSRGSGNVERTASSVAITSHSSRRAAVPAAPGDSP